MVVSRRSMRCCVVDRIWKTLVRCTYSLDGRIHGRLSLPSFHFLHSRAVVQCSAVQLEVQLAVSCRYSQLSCRTRSIYAECTAVQCSAVQWSTRYNTVVQKEPMASYGLWHTALDIGRESSWLNTDKQTKKKKVIGYSYIESFVQCQQKEKIEKNTGMSVL